MHKIPAPKQPDNTAQNQHWRYLTALVLMVLLFLTLYYYITYTGKLNEAVNEISNVFLEETSLNEKALFHSIIEQKTKQLQAMGRSAKKLSITEESKLRKFLYEENKTYLYDYLAFIDIDGNCYLGSKTIKATGKIKDLDALTQQQKDILSVDDPLFGPNIFLIGTPIEPFSFEGSEIVAAIAGFHLNALDKKLFDFRDRPESYTYIITKSGKIIMEPSNGKLDIGLNFFQYYEDRATSRLYDLDYLKNQINQNKHGSFYYRVGNTLLNSYYAPIENTDLYVLINMPEGIISENVESFSQFNLIVTACIIIFITISIFIIYRRKIKSSNELILATQKATRAKSEFLARMSHEIRTPMNAIMGMTILAQQNISNTPKLVSCLNKINISSEHLLSLINDILDMSKIESNKMQIASEDFNFKNFIESITIIFYDMSVNKNIDFKTLLYGDLEDFLVGDSVRLNQMLFNLLSNAVKFTPEGGKVTLSIEVTEKTQTDIKIRFSVTDTGCGIKEENLNKIFEAFEQESAKTALHYGGTGLGLSITKKLAELLSGTIEVKSKPLEGTTFILEIPFKHTDKSRNYSNKLLNLHAFVVDDEPATCEYVTYVLKQMGARADFVLNGEDAIYEIQKQNNAGQPFDVIFIDWNMPEMDGIEVTRAIRQLPSNEVPIIIISASDWSDIETIALDAGANGFISKPMFQSSIYNTVHSILKGETSIRTMKDNGKEKKIVSLSGKRIILAEDNLFNREFAFEILSNAGIIVDEAEDGLMACKLFEASPIGFYDAILMDIQMPNMDGYEATGKIRRMNRTDVKALPIIAMSANAFTEDVASALAAGMDGHISKPVNIDLLFQKLKELLDS